MLPSRDRNKGAIVNFELQKLCSEATDRGTEAHSGQTDSGIATATEVHVKQVLLVKPERIAKSALRAWFGRFPKSVAFRKPFAIKQKFFIRTAKASAEVVACSFGRTVRSGLRLPLDNEGVPLHFFNVTSVERQVSSL